jgi:hypothetical protein
MQNRRALLISLARGEAVAKSSGTGGTGGTVEHSSALKAPAFHQFHQFHPENSVPRKEVERVNRQIGIEADREERAAILEYEAGLPRPWAEPFARILCAAPDDDIGGSVRQRVLDAALTFADQWSGKALALGWDVNDVFGLHPASPCAGDDCRALAWLLAHGAKVVAIFADGADIVAADGAGQRYHRPSASVGV